MNCIFCAIPRQDILLENEHFFVIHDHRPVSRGHSLIVSKRHTPDYFEISAEESCALLDITKQTKALLDAKYLPKAYNLTMNCGARAGQTVFHYHMHVIPRY